MQVGISYVDGVNKDEPMACRLQLKALFIDRR
jgi:hypothetical protein